jgi:hypothetical protein
LAKILEFLKFQEWLSVRVDGPLWFRGYDKWTEDEGTTQVAKILDAYEPTHIVVGHTVQNEGRIRARFGSKVFSIDTGMFSSYYPGGRASALEGCDGRKFIAVYLDQQGVVLQDSAATPQQSEVTGQHAPGGKRGFGKGSRGADGRHMFGNGRSGAPIGKDRKR